MTTVHVYLAQVHNMKLSESSIMRLTRHIPKYELRRPNTDRKHVMNKYKNQVQSRIEVRRTHVNQPDKVFHATFKI
jgi:hypothetical protein